MLPIEDALVDRGHPVAARQGPIPISYGSNDSFRMIEVISLEGNSFSGQLPPWTQDGR